MQIAFERELKKVFKASTGKTIVTSAFLAALNVIGPSFNYHYYISILLGGQQGSVIHFFSHQYVN